MGSTAIMPLTSSPSFSSSNVSSGLRDSSGSPNNGRTLGRSISLNHCALITVLLSIYFFFKNAIFPRSHSQGETGADEGTRDVESGELQEASGNAFVVPTPPIVVGDGGGGSTESVAGTTSRENQSFVFEAEPGTDPANHVSKEENAVFSDPQFIGRQVIGIWILPTLVGGIGGLVQVAAGSQMANSEQKLALELCLGISLETAILGIVLFILSTMNWSNPRRGHIIRSIAVVAVGSTFVNTCAVITFGFIVVLSKSHD